MAFRALTRITVRSNATGICNRAIKISLNVCRDPFHTNKQVSLIVPQYCSRGYASKKKSALIYTLISKLQHNLTVKLKGALKLNALDENEAVDVEEVKLGMEDVLSGLRQSLAKLSVKISPGK